MRIGVVQSLMRRMQRRRSSQLLIASAMAVAVVLSTHGASAEPSAQQSSTGSKTRTAGWVAAGLGMGVLSTSLVMFYLESLKYEQLAQSESREQTIREMRNYHRAGQILFYAGVAGIGTGMALVLFAPKDETAPRVTVGLGYVAASASF
jgi:hypothetical protein